MFTIMRKKGCILVIAILMVVLTFCGKEDTNNLYEDISLSNDEIFLYSVVDERIGIYDMKNFTWTTLYDEENTFQYVFDNDSEYVVSGNSINNGFVLLKISEDRKRLNKVFELNNAENCFFPLASGGGEYYYVMYVNEQSQSVEREIFSFTEDYEIENILESEKKITAGVISENTLYYTVYNDLTDRYNLYSLQLSDNENVPVDLNRELETRDLFFYEGNLCVSDYDKIYCDSTNITKRYLNFIEQDYVIQFYANSKNDMVCTVKKISSGEKMGTFLNPINYSVADNEIIVYCHTGMYRIKM